MALFVHPLSAMAVFADRRDAGSRLALELQGYAERPDVVVVAASRGGIPVGYEIAIRLGLPLVAFDPSALGEIVPGSTIIVAVDGVETAASLIPYTTAIREWCPDELITAIPVACANACAVLEAYVDDIICLFNSPHGVELSYDDFSQGSDVEDRRLVQHAARQWRELSLFGSHGW
jgi:predicted phosphoribosyltransferase